MSKVFFDKLIVLDDVEKKINSISTSVEEKDELWQIVDEMICHKVMGICLDKLPKQHHIEFLDKFEKTPYDEAMELPKTYLYKEVKFLLDHGYRLVTENGIDKLVEIPDSGQSCELK